MSDRGASPKRKTVLKTFRFQEELVQALEKEAEEESTSLNALVATALARHSEWVSKARKIGMVHISKTLFETVLEAADAEKLSLLVRQRMPVVLKDMAMFWFQDESLEGIVRLLTLIARFSWGQDLAVYKDGRHYVVSMKHGFGPRFSQVLKDEIDELLRSIYHIQPKVEVSDSLVTFTFDEP